MRELTCVALTTIMPTMDESQVMYATLGKNIRQVRELATPKVSQAKLAERVGVSRVSVVNIEAGRQHAPVHLLWNIAKALDTDLTRLIPKRSDLIQDENPAALDRAFAAVIDGFSSGDDAIKRRLSQVVAQLSALSDGKSSGKSS